MAIYQTVVKRKAISFLREWFIIHFVCFCVFLMCRREIVCSLKNCQRNSVDVISEAIAL